jgi:predicted protein tyrosine phosphatase
MKKIKLLFLCSANMDRSPCAESLFEGSEKYEAKSAGLSELAEKKVSKEAIQWADVIFVMDERNEQHKSILLKNFPEAKKKYIIILNISNKLCRYDKELERLLKICLEREGFGEDFSKMNDGESNIDSITVHEICQVGKKIKDNPTKIRLGFLNELKNDNF